MLKIENESALDQSLLEQIQYAFAFHLAKYVGTRNSAMVSVHQMDKSGLVICVLTVLLANGKRFDVNIQGVDAHQVIRDAFASARRRLKSANRIANTTPPIV